ncbi:hypothetical protein LTR78_001310 [Recurvomyces mirabilis]|uniref:CCHC-type domain-containing protein n=1 Tax=Recurvomyces mirabilis TaxID=574656 RepID=A0AAE1C5J7_9PEZI|nr:hypothetical protein LTR78_001310 [Recurvomyces mirabilis]KAK5161287.1 hypothetical protein LTS14_001083 [Recurvomyces mirabilis]
MAGRDTIASGSSRQDIMNGRRNDRSPEESRAAIVGRKRGAPQDNLAGGDKRARLENDIITISDDEEDHRRGSIESGEVATSDSGMSEASAEITLETIDSERLRPHIRDYIEREDVSVLEAVRRFAVKNSAMPFAKEARVLARKWEHIEESLGPKRSKGTQNKTVAEQHEAIDISDDEGGVSVGGHAAHDDGGDYGALARQAATGNARADREMPGAVYLSDLSPNDQDLQKRYFGIIHPYEAVRCLGCGGQKHVQATCPANTCKHCVGDHFAHTCPTNRKCRRCRQRGHGSESCSNRPVYGGGSADKCDYCSETGHVEEECTTLWRTYHPDNDPEPVMQIFKADMRKACYNCASSQHWGDDCPTLPSFARALGKSGLWSGEHASRFIKDILQDEVLQDGRPDAWISVNQHSNAYQLAQFDD